MILRRVIDHVKAQNWFAVAIDFVIVVLGVFVGMQVNNWNGARIDRQRADGFLARIAADLDADLANYADRAQFWRRVREYGAIALTDSEAGGAVDGVDSWPLLLAYFQTSQVYEFTTTSATFDELKSAGDIGLIADQALRSRLAQYYGAGDNPALRERPRFREHVRSLVPFDIQSYIWTRCYASDAQSRQAFVDCPAPVSPERIAAALGTLRAEPGLQPELRYWMSTMEVAMIIARDRAENARTLREEIEGALQ